MTAKQVVSKALLAFVLVSIGFALGRELTLRSLRASGATPDAPNGGVQPPDQRAQSGAVTPVSRKVLVYYLHAPVRCTTCNGIERLARETLQQDFAQELADGRVVWQTANFQEREDLARKYNVTGSTLVAVQVQDGKETSFERLEKVWQLVSEPAEFAQYVSSAVRRGLQPGPKGGAP